MTIATKLSAFTFFPLLPPELRNQIWLAALPVFGPALYAYGKGYWERVENTDHPEGHGIYQELRYELADCLYFELPLLFVNREARGITSAWVDKQDTDIKKSNWQNGVSPIFIRTFNPKRDILYIPGNNYEDFIDEPENRRRKTDLLDTGISQNPKMVTRIAIPDTVVINSHPRLSTMIHHFLPKTVYIIIGIQPDLESTKHNVEAEWWDVETMQGGVFWNEETKRFDYGPNESIGDDFIHGLMEDTSDDTDLIEVFRTNAPPSFEIQPASVVKK
jgi:hypothetical protein